MNSDKHISRGVGRGLRSAKTMVLLAIILQLICVMAATSVRGETDSIPHEKFSLLMAPTAPGFVLMGKEPASVERPTAPADIAVTILTRTDDLTTVPEDFALEIAPYWMLGGGTLTYPEYAGRQGVWANLMQTLTLSMASSSTSESSLDTTASSVGFGLRFSLLQGHIDTTYEAYAARLDSVYVQLEQLNEDFDNAWRERKENDTILTRLENLYYASDEALQPAIDSLINHRRSEIKSEVDAEQDKLQSDRKAILAQLVSRLAVRRIGFVLNTSMGLVLDFPERDFDDGDLSRGGLWLTGGYQWSDWSALAVARYLHHDEDSLRNFDFGARLIFDNWRRFSLSAEGVYRSFPDRDSDESTWRAAFMVDYAIGENKSIAITFGRDFEGRQSGNLLTLINLVLGFGSERPRP